MGENVVVLGSGPNAVIPHGDIIYCANAAGALHAGEVSKFARSMTVAAEHYIACSKASQTEKTALHRSFEQIVGAPAQGLVVLRHTPWIEGWDLDAGIAEFRTRHGGPVELVSFAERQEMLERLTGLRDPVWTWGTFRELGLRNPMRLRGRFRWIDNLSEDHRKDVTIDVRAELRASTGMNALLLAIHRHGPTAQYHLCGIGLDPTSDRVSIAAKDGAKARLRPGGLTHHLHVDRRIWSILKKRYRISL